MRVSWRKDIQQGYGGGAQAYQPIQRLRASTSEPEADDTEHWVPHKKERDMRLSSVTETSHGNLLASLPPAAQWIKVVAPQAVGTTPHTLPVPGPNPRHQYVICPSCSLFVRERDYEAHWQNHTYWILYTKDRAVALAPIPVMSPSSQLLVGCPACHHLVPAATWADHVRHHTENQTFAAPEGLHTPSIQMLTSQQAKSHTCSQPHYLVLPCPECGRNQRADRLARHRRLWHKVK